MVRCLNVSRQANESQIPLRKSGLSKVWWKYLQRLEWERDLNNRSATGPTRKANEGFGGSREAHKQMRKAEVSDFLEAT